MTSADLDSLKVHDTQTARLGTQAEGHLQEDPNTSLLKSRQFAELLGGPILERISKSEGFKVSNSTRVKRLACNENQHE